MKFWVFLCIVLLPVVSVAQDPTEQIDFWLGKAAQVRNTQLDSAVYYYKQAHVLAVQNSSVQQRARVSYLYAYYLLASNRYDEAQETIRFNTNHKEELSYDMLGNTYYTLGSLYYLKEEYDSALLHFMEAEHYFEWSRNTPWLARSQLQLSVIYNKLGNLKMENYFADASLATLNQEKANAQAEVPVTPLQKINFLTSQLRGDQLNQNDQIRSHLFYSLGLAYFENKNFAESIPWFKQSLAIKQRAGYANLISETKTYIAEAYLEMGQYKEAVSIVQEIQPAHKRKRPLAIEAVLIAAYKGLGDYEKALAHKERLTKLKDSVANLNENERIAEITAQFETEKQAAEIALLETRNTLQASKL